MGEGQSKAALSSHSISCSSGLRDLGVGGLLSFFLLCLSSPTFTPLLRAGAPFPPHSQTTGPSGPAERAPVTGSCSLLGAPHFARGPGDFSASFQPRTQGALKTQESGRKGGDQRRCLLPAQRAIYTRNRVAGLWGSAAPRKLSWFMWAHSQSMPFRGNV